MPQHHRSARKRPSELPVKVQRWRQTCNSLAKIRNVSQLLVGESLQNAQARTVIGLRKNHVKSDRASALPLEQLIGQCGHFVA